MTRFVRGGPGWALCATARFSALGCGLLLAAPEGEAKAGAIGAEQIESSVGFVE